MRENISKFKKTNSALSNGFLALIIVGLIGLGCTCNDKEGFNWGSKKENSSNKDVGNDREIAKADASKGEMPSDEELQEIVKETLLDFDKAVLKGDFSDFYKSISKEWKSQSKPETFNKGFDEFIKKRISIGSIRNKEADFSPDPKIDTSQRLDVLEVAGSYATSPNPTKFELSYVPNGKEWKLFAIRVDNR